MQAGKNNLAISQCEKKENEDTNIPEVGKAVATTRRA